MRILIVEDDVGMAEFLRTGLRESGYALDVAADGHEGLRLATSHPYDAIILDLMLPGLNGLAVLRELRSREIDTPVICLTARHSVDDRIRGLDLGADDYLAKPFNFAELLARLRALLRRGQSVVANPIVVSDLCVDVVARTATRGGQRLELSPTEFALLEFLARHKGEILSRTMILEHVWDLHQDPLSSVLEVHVNRLRKKVDHGFAAPLIHTVRGIGYVLREDAS
ncbi:MAG: Transcriptional regulatory protein CusR [Phycisphaerae bacterium]|nr:Transcriptional regulatory protein CusR [Phycisphaerae bacterium]